MGQQRIEEETTQRRLGREIKQRRLELGLSRRDLQEATGLSYPYLSEIETGKKMPSTKVLRRVAGVLGTEASDLLQAAEGTSEARMSAPADRYFHRAPRAAAAERAALAAPVAADMWEEDQNLELIRLMRRLPWRDRELVLSLARRLAESPRSGGPPP